MKRLLFIFITLLLLVAQVFAQDQTANVMSTKNTTTTVLDSAGVYTGTAELLRGYNSISITIRADQSGTYKVLFGNTSTITTANAVKTYSFSYTANDTLHTKTIGTDAPYVKVVFTSSGVVAQTKFYLITMLNRGDVLPRTTAGKVDVADSGAGTSLDNVEADADSIVDKVTEIDNNTDLVEAKLDSIDQSLTRVEADVEEVRTNGVKVKAGADMIGYTNLSDTPITAAFTAGVVADTLSGTSVTCKGVLITNNSAGKVLYLIHSAAGTTSTGTPIYYLGSVFVTTTNLNKVYLISDTASTDVRILYYQ